MPSIIKVSNINLYIRKARDYQDFDKENIEEAINWLKFLRPQFLRPQSQWKPSDEQIMAIDTAINVVGKGTLSGKQLIELQEDLKKLK